MKTPLRTADVARLLSTTYFRVYCLIRHRKIPPPVRDRAGNFCWSAADVARARAAIDTQRGRGRPRKAG